MDPMTLFFASYMDAVSSRAYQQMQDPADGQLQTISVQHNGQQVSYQHRQWQIREASICADRKADIKQFSTCTVAAKSLFGEICLQLQLYPKEHWKYLRLKEMYCSTASAFQPTIASIDWSGAEDSELSLAKQACSTATAAAIGTRDPRILKKRDIACTRYRQIKRRQGER
jgi:hypothetical protein